MSKFKILAKDGNARRGVVTTLHGEINTPAFMPVGTAATVKGVLTDDMINNRSRCYSRKHLSFVFTSGNKNS